MPVLPPLNRWGITLDKKTWQSGHKVYEKLWDLKKVPATDLINSEKEHRKNTTSNLRSLTKVKGIFLRLCQSVACGYLTLPLKGFCAHCLITKTIDIVPAVYVNTTGQKSV